MTAKAGRADIVCTNSAALSRPGGHYSHLCTAGGFVHVSGLLPIAADGTPLTGRPFEEQAAQVLRNLTSCLREAGLGPDRLVQVRVYVAGIAHWPAFDRLYAAWIGEHRPARSVAGVAELHFGLAIEVEAVALARA